MKKYILDDNGYYLGTTNHEDVTHTKIEKALPELTDIQTAKWDGSQWVVEEDPAKVKYKANEWKRNRQFEYPSIQDVVVALAEKEEGNDSMWQEITAQRAKVKADNPKPE